MFKISIRNQKRIISTINILQYNLKNLICYILSFKNLMLNNVCYFEYEILDLLCIISIYFNYIT